MATGSRGTFVISWSQTEVDGIIAASDDALTVGATWRWTGDSVRVDAAMGPLLLEGAGGTADLHRRAARMVRRLVGTAVGAGTATPAEAEPDGARPHLDPDLPDRGFLVTDGRHSFAVSLIDVPDTGTRLAMFVGSAPPRDRDLWILRLSVHAGAPGAVAAPQAPAGVICFTPETRLATPDGARRILDLRPGDRILTRDNGPQEVLWTGQRRMSGARLYAMPHLRPIRFRAGAFGIGQPDEDLLVSPQHRMLVRGPDAMALFGTPEVLVRAEDLLNDTRVSVDLSLREVTYVHILLERHNIVWANGLETESFHPAQTDLGTLDPLQHEALLQVLPGIDADPLAYGDPARRNLTPSQAAILLRDTAA